MQSFWCQASGTSGDWGIRGDDVVGDVVLDGAVRGAHLCECRELRQKIKVRVTLFLGSNGRAGRGVLCKNSLDMQVRGRVRQLVLSHVRQESKVPEEVCSDDWLWTSAMMNIHWKVRRRPRLRVSERLPYVGIGVSLTAIRVSLSGVCLRSEREGGMMLTSEPVSTRKHVTSTLI